MRPLSSCPKAPPLWTLPTVCIPAWATAAAARIDGAMVPLNTPLQNGQTVEVITVKEGGPSRDWLNPELGFLSSQRAKSKVRAWFNALAMAQTVAKGREAVENCSSVKAKPP